MQSGLTLLAVLFTFGTVFFFSRYCFLVFNSWLAEGLVINRRLSFGKNTKDLPRIFRYRDYSIWLLPFVRICRRKNLFEINKLYKEFEELLVISGLRPHITVEHLLALSFLSALAIGVYLGAFFLLFFNIVFSLMFFIVGLIVGYKLPRIFLKRFIEERISLIEKRLPFAIEFILLGVESGSDFVDATKTFCNEMGKDYLADEFKIFLTEFVRFGRGQKDALSELSNRVRSDLFKSFIMAIEQAIVTGQPIRETLQIQAAAIRQARYEAAEEIAKKASTKSTFPLIIIVIAVFLLLIGPLLISFSSSSL